MKYKEGDKVIMLQELLLCHPVTKRNEEVKQLLDTIQTNLQELHLKCNELVNKGN